MCIILMYMGFMYVHSPRIFGWKGLSVAFLGLLLLSLGVRESVAAEPSADVPKNTLSKSQDSETKQGEKSPLWGNEKRTYVGDNGDDGGGALQMMVVYSVIILVLGVGAVLVVKKLLPKIQRSAGKNLSIIETAYISQRNSVHLLKVGRKKYLIARSGDGISLLAEVTQALDDQESTSGSGE